MNTRNSFITAGLLACGLVVAVAAGCGSVDGVYDWDGYVSNNNGNGNQVWPDATMPDFVYLEGTVWSPGADQAVEENNRFPIPSAAVIAFAQQPPDLPQAMYCHECVEIPSGTIHTFSDPVDGTFTLGLIPGATYYLTVQKGEFRRVRQITAPNTPNETFTFDSGGPTDPRPTETTLPNRTDLGVGDSIPKIAYIGASYEDMGDMFTGMGFAHFDSNPDITVFSDSIWGEYTSAQPVMNLLGNPQTLAQYNIVVVPCGSEWPASQSASAAANLKTYVRNGGKLYVDDWNYDFVEQVWPEFLTFWDGGECGGGTTPPAVNVCNSSPSYNFGGDPGPQDFADWLALPEVNRGADLILENAWDYIYSMDSGEIGIDTSGECTNCGPNGEIYAEPFVWMYNADSSPAGAHLPATVSWPYHCGKVLFTVYHTEPGDGSGQLLLQEKIMMYLIMEIQTCTVDPIVN